MASLDAHRDAVRRPSGSRFAGDPPGRGSGSPASLIWRPPPTSTAHLRALEEGEGIRIVLDLSELSFMDSAGLAVILEAERRAGERRRSLVIRRPSRQVTRLLELAGVSLTAGRLTTQRVACPR